MTTPEVTPTPEAQTEPAGDPSGETNPQLRDARDRAITRAENAEKQLVEVHLGKMGLSPTEGLGVAVAESFKGEVTFENIQSHAADKYKYVYDPASVGAAGSLATPAEQMAAGAQNVGTQVMGAARSVQPTDEQRAQSQVTEAKFASGEAMTENEIVGGIAAKMALLNPRS